MNLRLLLLIIAIASFVGAVAEAQPRGRTKPQFVSPEQLNPGEGEAVLTSFRTARLAGDYAFLFELRHMPRRGKTQVHTGSMWGTWDRSGRALTRIHLATKPETRILQIGGEPGAVFKQIGDEPVELVAGRDKFQPVVNGITFSPFELQMPFLFWTDYVYEGTEKLRGRPAHYFLLYPPDDFELTEVGGVRVMIDADFNALLRAEILDPEGRALKTFKINSFKKVDDQWIVKTIDLIDEKTRDKTRFEIIAAAVGKDLPTEIFEPESLSEDIAPISWQEFQSL